MGRKGEGGAKKKKKKKEKEKEAKRSCLLAIEISIDNTVHQILLFSVE